MDKKINNLILENLENKLDKIVEEQMLDLFEKFPSMKLKEEDVKNSIKKELKKQFLFIKENPNFDEIEPSKKTLDEVISKIPLFYNETVLMYKFICDYINKNNIQYDYYTSLKEFNKTISSMKNNKELELENLFLGNDIFSEVILQASNTPEELNIFKDLINNLEKNMKYSELVETTRLILDVVKNYPSILKMKIHNYLNFN